MTYNIKCDYADIKPDNAVITPGSVDYPITRGSR